jgi:hypothetical protein
MATTKTLNNSEVAKKIMAIFPPTINPTTTAVFDHNGTAIVYCTKLPNGRSIVMGFYSREHYSNLTSSEKREFVEKLETLKADRVQEWTKESGLTAYYVKGQYNPGLRVKDGYTINPWNY